MNVPEFDKHLKKAEGHIGRDIVEITIKMKTIVRKTLMIKKNSIYSLCGDRDETISHIISNCSKLAQKEYKTRHDLVVLVIH